MEKIEGLHEQIKEVYADLESTQNQLQGCLRKLAKFERKYKDETSANKELRYQLKHVQRKLHKYKKLSKKDTVDAETQTCSEVDYYANGWNAGGDGGQTTHSSEIEKTTAFSQVQPEEPQSIADSLKAAAESAMQQTGYTYDELTGLYYDHNTGYYYDSEKSLYYESSSGTYYYYDTQSDSYQFHSQVDVKEIERQYEEYYRKQTASSSSRRPAKTKKASKSRSDPPSCKEPPSREPSSKESSAELLKMRRKLRKQTRTPQPSVITSEKVDLKPIKDGAPERKKSLKAKPVNVKKDDEAAMESYFPWQLRPLSPQSDVKVADDKEELSSSVENMETGSGSEGKVGSEESEASGSSESSELEEGEVASSEEEESVEEEEEEEVEPVHYPPCIRAIVTESDKLDLGQLFMITCTGATIGREPGLGHLIQINDTNISKMHCDIKYDEHLMKYVVKDHASQNGTFINSVRLSAAKTMSNAFPVQHLNVLEVGGTKLELHIHPGSDTCDNCEPGLVQAKLNAAASTQGNTETAVMSKEEKENQRRQQLKLIKKKFGLGNSGYVDNPNAVNNPNYKDKSEERRRTKGSDNPYQKDDVPASVHRPIAATNKGHKLLAKMGWKEGESLGKSQQGIAEPISVNIRSQKSAGLGAFKQYECSLDNVQGVRNAAVRAKTRERFEKAGLLPADVESVQLQPPAPIQTTQTQIGKITWRKGQTINTAKDAPRVNLADDSEEEGEET